MRHFRPSCLGQAPAWWLLGASAAAAAAAKGVEVHTARGPIRGARLGAEGGAFYLVPFARPPTGDLRFGRPELPDAWTEVLDVSKPPNGEEGACLQYSKGRGVYGTEDCLKLFVYSPKLIPRPSRVSSGALPVLVFIHGGSWYLGDGYEGGRYSGAALALHHGVVVVCVQYRLGPFGFLALPELRHTDGAVGNTALLDQRHGLRWVRANIAAFGGDPSRVVVFGAGTGAASVCWHLASPGSRGLFRGAIVESGPCGSNMLRVGDAMKRWERASALVGCTGSQRLGCLRSWDARDLLLSRLSDPTMYTIVIDGAEESLPDGQLQLMASGRGSAVPLIIGTSGHRYRLCDGHGWPPRECPLLQRGWGRRESPKKYIEGIVGVQISEKQWDQVGRLYPAKSYPDRASWYGAMAADVGWMDTTFMLGGLAWSGQCNALAAAGAVSVGALAGAGIRTPAWVYDFNVTGKPSWRSSLHADEISFVFQTCGSRANGSVLPYTQCWGALNEMSELSNMLATYWTNFAKTLDPNFAGDRGARAGLPHWDQGLERVLVIDGPGKRSRMAPPHRGPFCGFWQKLLGGASAVGWTPVEHRGGIDGFELLRGKDAFPGQDVEKMPASDLGVCKRLCKERGYGAFIVFGDTAFFRAESAVECSAHLVDRPGVTTYINWGLDASPEAMDPVRAGDGGRTGDLVVFWIRSVRSLAWTWRLLLPTALATWLLGGVCLAGVLTHRFKMPGSASLAGASPSQMALIGELEAAHAVTMPEVTPEREPF